MKPTSNIPLIRPQLAALYEYLGGETRLIEILDNFYERMSKDTMIGFFFMNKDLKKIAKTQSEFLMRAMGAIPSYTGKPPAQAHEKLAPILSGHFDRRIVILEETLKSFGLPDNHIAAWISFEKSFRDGIVKKD